MVLSMAAPAEAKDTVSASGMNSCNDGWFHTSGTFTNHCPQCGAYNCLEWNPKGTPEGEWTCSHCDADYCICGKCKGGHGASLQHPQKVVKSANTPISNNPKTVQKPTPPTPKQIVSSLINKPIIVLTNK